MPTSTEIKNNNNTLIRAKTAAASITKANVADQLDASIDYTDQQAPIKTSGIVVLSDSIQSVLPKDINACNTVGGLAYLPSTTMIGREILVLAVSNNIEIFANLSNTEKMFATYPTSIASIVLTTNQFYRFTYLGLGTGTGGVVDGYWKAELLN